MGKSNQFRNLSQEEKNKIFINRAKEIYGDRFDYSKLNFINSQTKITIICPKHGEFQQKPHKHLSGHGCPTCGNKKNITELRILEKLKVFFPNIEYQKTFNFLKRNSYASLRIDYYLPNYKIGIEYQGIQHFIPVDIFGGENEYYKTIERDKFKYDECKKKMVLKYYIFQLANQKQ